MPVKAGHYGQWEDAEVVRFEVGGPVILKYAGESRLLARQRQKWISVDPVILEQANEDPSRFKSNVRTLPNGRQIIPDGAVALDADLALPPGTPLLIDGTVHWKEGYVVEESNGKIKIRNKHAGPRFDKSYSRDEFAITEETLQQLDDPDAIKRFAANIELQESRYGSSFPKGSGLSKSKQRSRPARITEYPIDIKLPQDAQIVPEDLSLPTGTALAACWANRWHPVTVISENDDGSLYVQWDEYSSAHNRNLKRSDLAIENETVLKLQTNAKPQAKGSSASDAEAEEDRTPEKTEISELADDQWQGKLRTWTDSSGLFTIEATYVGKTKKRVMLKMADGREIKIPLDKLSAADRKLIED